MVTLNTSSFKIPEGNLRNKLWVDSYLQREVMPLPVGMQTDIQSRTGSIHSVPSTSMAEWDIVKLTITRSPNETEVAGMLIAFPTWAHPCNVHSVH